MVLTFRDGDLPDFQIEYSKYLDDRESCYHLPIFTKNFSEERSKCEEELKNLTNEFEEYKVEELKMRQEIENLSATCTEKLKQLETLSASVKELELQIKDIEDSKSKEELESLESAKKTLHLYKRLMKLKWLHSSADDVLESVIFNDNNAYLKYVKFDKTDPLVTEKVWVEISKACDSSWRNLLSSNASLGIS